MLKHKLGRRQHVQQDHVKLIVAQIFPKKELRPIKLADFKPCFPKKNPKRHNFKDFFYEISLILYQ